VKKRMILLLLFIFGASLAVFAEETIESLTTATDMIWLVLTGSLVFFMQAGFAMVETGLTRTRTPPIS